MRPLFSQILLAALFFAAGWVSALWFRDPDGVGSGKPPGPWIQTEQMPPIVGLEIPIRSKEGHGPEALLKAAFADQTNEKELRVYGGFEYRTGDKLITGDEAVIDLATGTTRKMKGIRIWERAGATSPGSVQDQR